MEPRFEQFIRERQYFANVSPATIEWYRRCLKWLPSECPTQDQLRDTVLRMRQKGLKETGVKSCSDASMLTCIGIAALSANAYPARRGVTMPSSEAFPTQNVKFSFDKLSTTADTLNAASHRLNEAIDRLNGALKQLNLGIASWVRVWTFENDHVSDIEEIGYARVRGKWGICIRKTVEWADGQEPDGNEWHFADAPRDLRLRAISHLNELVATLNNDAERAAQIISERAFDAAELADTLTAIAEKSRSVKKGGER